MCSSRAVVIGAGNMGAGIAMALLADGLAVHLMTRRKRRLPPRSGGLASRSGAMWSANQNMSLLASLLGRRVPDRIDHHISDDPVQRMSIRTDQIGVIMESQPQSLRLSPRLHIRDSRRLRPDWSI
ncbi:3-hydroxyacyl-CoA dehydrogenase [Paraburkholderia youngii]|uniref:3-hydroxyacyl-CoA dehydrogenase NAD-binding domain-containing protein n=1 Tax=Paraburkholderia youngii TaxID=2782701 RepID=UPI003D1F230D